MTDDSAVLGWILAQAGVVTTSKTPTKVEDFLPLPVVGVDASRGATETPKVVPSKPKGKAEAVEANTNAQYTKPAPKENPTVKDDTPTPVTKDEAINEKVDTIKNDNNVVAFFCEYICSYYCFYKEILRNH